MKLKKWKWRILLILISALIFLAVTFLSSVQGVADGSTVSYYFVEKGYPLAWLEMMNHQTNIRWNYLIIDYIIILAIVTIVSSIGQKLFIKLRIKNMG